MSELTIARKYRLKRELGRGGMGSVFEAIHVPTGRRVALKVMRAEEGEASHARMRFEREALAVGRLATQHAVLVYDAGVDEASNQPFIAMELLEGEDVSQLLRRLGPLRPELAVAIVAQACAGLEKAHAAGIVHRDIKPSNLFLTRTEHGELIVKILDFGIAKLSRSTSDEMHDGGGTITATGTLVGSPHYMSPEQAKGLKTVDHRTDIWSLGVLLHKCLSGRTPFDGHTTLGQVIVAVCSEDPVSVQEHAPWVSPELAFVIRQALARDPSKRLQSAPELLAALAPHIPWGARITDALLAPLDSGERAHIAPRCSEFPSQQTPATGDIPAIGPTMDISPANPSSTMHGVVPFSPKEDPASVTGAGGSSFVTSPSAEAAPTAPRRWVAVVVGVAAAIAVTSISLVVAPRLRSRPASSLDVHANQPSAALSTAQPNPAGSISSGEARPAEQAPLVRKERVSVSPSGVRVEVDGHSVDVEGGAVLVGGTIGSVHSVRLSHGGREVTSDVVLTDHGPRPERVALTMASAAPTVGRHGGAPPQTATRAPAVTAPPTAKPSAKAGGSFDQRFE